MSQTGISIITTFPFHWQEFSHMATLTAREFGKCHLAEYSGGKKSKLIFVNQQSVPHV